MQDPVFEPHPNKSSLPLLVVFQFVLTMLTLGYVVYARLFMTPVEYPVVIVQPSKDAYVEKHNGSVTIFDLADISEWHQYNDPEATTSSKNTISFLYPPNFDITRDGNNTVHLSQNNTDFMMITSMQTEITKSQIPSLAKFIQFNSRNKFYQSVQNSSNEPVIYQGGINGYGLTVVDTKQFSPEVVYLILMSMDYIE
jgi:hypothetical protein